MERLPGFRDFYPDPTPHADLWSADARQYIFEKWRATARSYCFREYDGPPLETLALFTAKSGDEIVGQLYNFQDKGKREIALRPEMTPTLARMIAAHERSYKKPIKWFAIPQLFRYEKHQKGRLREHFQLNADIIGETDPSADAELIALLIDILRAFGLGSDDFVVRLSSRNAWHEYFQRQKGDPSKEYAFYQVIDKLERETDPAVSEQKLAALGLSLKDVTHFIEKGEPTSELRRILAELEARGLSPYVKVDYGVIRGLAYYTGPVFEAFALKTDLRAIAGGGRYDNLIQLLSGGKLNLPALGFGMGDVVLTELLKERNLLPPFSAGVDLFVLIEDESLRGPSLALIQQLREAGYSVDFPLVPGKPDKQFKRAQEVKAGRTLKLERNEQGDFIARVKDLNNRKEISVPSAKVIDSLKP